jgi:cytochrome c556
VNRRMKRVFVAAGCLLGLGMIGAATAQNDAGAIKYRQSIMKGVGGHTGAIALIVKKNNPNRNHLATHAHALEGLVGMINDAFAPKTSGGETRAKAKVWTDAEGFKDAASDAQVAAKAFHEAVGSGNDAEIDAKLDSLLKTCKGCHDEYREKKK